MHATPIDDGLSHDEPPRRPPSSSSSHTRVAPDAALLYRLGSPRPIPSGTLPAPHLDLMSPIDIKATSLALAIFFPPADGRSTRGESLYPVQFLPDSAEIVLNTKSLSGAYATIPTLISNVPAINAWLVEWSGSTDRFPKLDPPWAITMGFDKPAVRAIADGIAHHLALPDETRITIRDTAMHTAILSIPARAQLVAHAAGWRKSIRDVEVERVETVPIALTPGGAKVLLYLAGVSLPATPTIPLDATTFRRTSVGVPKRIRIVHLAHRQGVPRHD